MTYHYQKYEWTAFREADFLDQGGNGTGIGCGDTFTMPTGASVCMSTYDNDSTLSGDSYCNENANDHSGQQAYIDGAAVGGQMYAERYHVLQGSDGKKYYLIEIEVEGHDAAGNGEDYFTFYGAVPPAGVELHVTNTCNVRGEWVDFKCIGAGEKAPVNEAPTFTNVPEDGILCVDENTTFVIDLAADDADGDTLTYEIVGGRDASFFEIDATTGELTFKGAPDYENPQSGGGNNTYDVTVKVSDGNGGEEIKPLWVKVKDVDEGTGGECIVIEAEDMTLCGYRVEHNDAASGGAVVKGQVGCWASAKTTFEGTGGEYDLKLSVIDENDGQGLIYVYVNGVDVSGPIKLNQDNGGNGVSDSSFREIVLEDLQLNPGDKITIWGYGEGYEFARLDKIELCKDGDVDPMTASIGDTVWFDADKDGIQDADEVGIEGITVNLKDADGNVIDTTTTDADGNYLFDGLAAGDYSVAVVPANGLVFTTTDAGADDAADSDVDGATGMTGIISLAEGEENLTVDAGLVDPGTAAISGRYFCDENDNDVDDGEPAIVGATVELLDAAGNVIATTTTDADGNYEFTGLDAGDYSVRFAADADGKTFVDQNVGGDDTVDSDVDGSGTTGTISVGVGETSTDNDAGVEDPGTASLAGRVFCDDNDDSIDNSEDGVSGVRVVLLTVAGAFVAETTTAADGSYEFTGLNAGEYKVSFDESTAGGKVLVDSNVGDDDTVDSDADQTTGETGGIVINIGDNITDVDAGVEDPGTASLGDRLFLDANGNGQQDDGEVGFADVTVTLYDGEGTAIATTTTDGSGNYLFGGLDAGDYSVGFDDVVGFDFTSQNTGDDATDSDADATGRTDTVSLAIGEENLTVDAGLIVENADPEAMDDAGKICANEELAIDVLANDIDADGDDLTVTAVNGVAISEGETIDVDGVFVTLTGGTLMFDAETALEALNIGEEQTINYSYTIEDGNGGSDVANIAATFCGTAETVEEICASLPSTINYQIVDGYNAGNSDAYTIQLSGSGDARLDGLVIEAAYCVSALDPAAGGLDFASAPLHTANLYCTYDGALPADVLEGQVGLNGLSAEENLDLVNWILNQDFTSQGYTDAEVQAAVWGLTDSIDFIPSAFGDLDDVREIVALAEANGEGFVAGAGDIVGLIVDPNPATDENAQPFIIGVSFDDLDCIC